MRAYDEILIVWWICPRCFSHFKKQSAICIKALKENISFDYTKTENLKIVAIHIPIFRVSEGYMTFIPNKCIIYS